MGAIITLTTDFGLADGYVAAMKGVILGINPDIRLVDVCHDIRPQDIAQAAFVLSTVYDCFPRRAVHLVVVDPGVGTERRAVVLRTPEADFVAPDNGVLSYVVRRYSNLPEGDGRLELAPGLEAVSITTPDFWRRPVSATFHGRDIFAPVAAHLASGVPPADFGEALTSLEAIPLPRPYRGADGRLVGSILHIDTFGNVITSLRADDLPPDAGSVSVAVGSFSIDGLARTYADGDGLLALIGSSGYLEIALSNGSAAGYLGAGIGDEVKVRI